MKIFSRKNSTALAPRYRSAAAKTRLVRRRKDLHFSSVPATVHGLVQVSPAVSPARINNVPPATAAAAAPPPRGAADLVQDSGSEYGDINDVDLEGEETLEKIDENALKIFPVCFLVRDLTIIN